MCQHERNYMQGVPVILNKYIKAVRSLTTVPLIKVDTDVVYFIGKDIFI